MLSLDEDGDVENLCEGDEADGDCGHTHYLFKAVDENGRTMASRREWRPEAISIRKRRIQWRLLPGGVFRSESGDVTLSVSLGRMVGGKFKAMSDTASVMFEAPDDLQALDQTFEEYQNEIDDIVDDYDENDDAVRWLGEDNTGDDRSIWNADTESSFAHAFYGGDGAVGGISDSTATPATTNADDRQGIVIAHLNNQLK